MLISEKMEDQTKHSLKRTAVFKLKYKIEEEFQSKVNNTTQYNAKVIV